MICFAKVIWVLETPLLVRAGMLIESFNSVESTDGSTRKLQNVNFLYGGKTMRATTKELIDSVNRGEEVVITYRGKPCAKLVPCQEIKRQTETNEVFVMWEDNEMVSINKSQKRRKEFSDLFGRWSIQEKEGFDKRIADLDVIHKRVPII